MSDLPWLDRAEYPFAHRSMDVQAGRIHYVDEGQGEPIVMVHGNPTWSFLFRHLIRGLAPQYRCIAPDHLGFGLSDKPARAPYRPRDHAENLYRLIEDLGLRGVTLAVHDFGGPIGLSYAIARPSNVRGLVLFNTWMWSRREDPRFPRPSRLRRGRLGHLLHARFNTPLRTTLRRAAGRRRVLAAAILRQYLGPFAGETAREGPWIMARELIGSSDWYANLWAERDRIRHLPAFIAWGMRDRVFSPDDLARWRELFAHARVAELADVGGLPPEEGGATLVPEIDAFMREH